MLLCVYVYDVAPIKMNNFIFVNEIVYLTNIHNLYLLSSEVTKMKSLVMMNCQVQDQLLVKYL